MPLLTNVLGISHSPDYDEDKAPDRSQPPARSPAPAAKSTGWPSLGEDRQGVDDLWPYVPAHIWHRSAEQS